MDTKFVLVYSMDSHDHGEDVFFVALMLSFQSDLRLGYDLNGSI